MKKRFTRFIILFISLAIFSGCATRPEIAHTEDLFALNTFLSFRAYGKHADKAIDEAIERIHEIENRMSITIEQSDVAQINANAGIRPVKVQKDTFHVIKTALYYSELTNGKFDITIYPIARLWGIGTNDARVPDESEIQRKLPLVNYRNVLLDEENMTVFLSTKGMGIDLGGIAKGYAADEAARIFKEAGVKHAILNMGGSITTIGGRPDETSWRIGVRNPRGTSDDLEFMAVIESIGLSVLSAGDYERYIVDVYRETGVRYHHIFDPFTGYPAKSGVIATTVVSSLAIEADALSTAMLIMGAKEGLSMIESIEGVQGLAITDEKEVFVTQGLKQYIVFTDPSYSVMP